MNIQLSYTFMHNIIGAFDKYNFAHSKLLTFVIIILSTFHFTSLKEQDTMDQRPIKGSSTGKYNMKFVDPTNDIALYCNSSKMSQLQMQMPWLQDLIEQYFQTIVYSLKQKAKVDLGDTFKYGKNRLTCITKQSQKDIQREHFMDHCSVCTQFFKQKQQIKMLPCRHCFHKQCIKPWFQNHTKCPNCRFDLYKEQDEE